MYQAHLLNEQAQFLEQLSAEASASSSGGSGGTGHQGDDDGGEGGSSSTPLPPARCVHERIQNVG